MTTLKSRVGYAVATAAVALGTLGTPAIAATPPPPGPAATDSSSPSAQDGTSSDQGGSPSAEDLLTATQNSQQVSNGTFTSSEPGHDDVTVGKSGNAFVFRSGMSIDCDGQAGDQCSTQTDQDFQPETTVQQSDGKPFNAATTPYIVLPKPTNSTWNYRDAGIGPGDVAAVIHDGHVVYAVFADVGPSTKIGEASYATAKALGIDPDPAHGGTSDDVTYIVFPHTRPDPVESPDQALASGQAAAAQLVNGTTSSQDPQQSSPDGARQQTLQRASTWLTADNGQPVPYSQSKEWKDGYRQDCSGYVSMALGLDKPGLNTVALANTRSVTRPIPMDQLKPGDLVIDATGTNKTRHVVIFEKWDDTAHSSYTAYDQNGSHGTQHASRTYGLEQNSEYKAYTPVAYNN